MKRSKNGTAGFTLLEVLVALSITALCLGTILAALGQSRRLAWSAVERLDGLNAERAALHAAFLGLEADGGFVAPPKLTDLAILEATGPITGPLPVLLEQFRLSTAAGAPTGIRIRERLP